MQQKVLGFTLIEMIVSIVIMGVVFLAITSFVVTGVDGYLDTVDRSRIQQQARFVVEKMSREIRNAIPNSFATNDTDTSKCMTFYSTRYAGAYTWQEDNQQLQFVIGQESPQLSDDSRIIINPSQYGDFLDGAAANHSLNGVALTDNMGTLNGIVLQSNSVSRRHYIYQASDEIEYCLKKNTVEPVTLSRLTRNNIVVADGVVFNESSFVYTPPSLQRGGLVHLGLLFEQNKEQSAYEHDVQVLNVP